VQVKFFLLILKNVRRNLVLSSLTSLGTMVLVLVVTLVWSVLAFLDRATSEKKQNLKAIITERWQIPSQMPYAYAATLTDGAAREPDDVHPLDSMTWSFYGGTTDLKNRTLNNTVFAFGLEPHKLRTMMDDLDNLPADQAAELQKTVEKLKQNRQGLVVGRERLALLDKRVGERIKLYGINYRGIDLEMEIVGVFPPGRYDKSAAMNRQYLLDAIDMWPRTHNGQKHFLAEKCLNLVWLRVPDTDAFSRVATQIDTAPYYSNPSVKCETASSGIATFLDAYRDLLWGMRWLLAPAALVSVALVIANAIGISVRQRRMELAVMKVLGFRPLQIMLLVLGESLLLGAGAGFLSSALTWYVVNNVLGGVPFPIAFFPTFLISRDALWWGPAVGGLAALAGSLSPAWSACMVKVSDVFAKVT
jgi:putative ABC transport system permease protein